MAAGRRDRRRGWRQLNGQPGRSGWVFGIPLDRDHLSLGMQVAQAMNGMIREMNCPRLLPADDVRQTENGLAWEMWDGRLQPAEPGWTARNLSLPERDRVLADAADALLILQSAGFDLPGLGTDNLLLRREGGRWRGFLSEFTGLSSRTGLTVPLFAEEQTDRTAVQAFGMLCWELLSGLELPEDTEPERVSLGQRSDMLHRRLVAGLCQRDSQEMPLEAAEEVLRFAAASPACSLTLLLDACLGDPASLVLMSQWDRLHYVQRRKPKPSGDRKTPWMTVFPEVYPWLSQSLVLPDREPLTLVLPRAAECTALVTLDGEGKPVLKVLRGVPWPETLGEEGPETAEAPAGPPAAEPEAPAAEPEPPAAEPETPAAEVKAPAAEPEAPAAEVKAPAAETKKPEAPKRQKKEKAPKEPKRGKAAETPAPAEPPSPASPKPEEAGIRRTLGGRNGVREVLLRPDGRLVLTLLNGGRLVILQDDAPRFGLGSVLQAMKEGG